MTYTATYSPKTTSSASIPSPGSPGRLRRSQEARLYQGTKTGAIWGHYTKRHKSYDFYFWCGDPRMIPARSVSQDRDRRILKARPISCNDSPDFQRRHMSIRCSAESLSRFPCAINTTFRK
ncbi:hypothetical protein BDD14_5722 [Edaphobacter modestus]|uniref:Uncharacterized protein n=1 Tax=Edaphobacter modestus TaxID=388466 RepID=A0A4Q7YF67_9BACT|nr:hypothetical protein BDD14_5722 [Edaphobacter modestus]